MDLNQFAADWRNTQYVNQGMHERFTALVNQNPYLKAHRDWVESHIFGFGERSFHWLHKIVVDEMPENFSFLEIGGFRMQVVSLYELIANSTGKTVTRSCVSPMSGMDGHWESDYFADSDTIHDAFLLSKDYKLYHGDSTNPEIISMAKADGLRDVVYIDGGHTKPVIESDLRNYVDLVKSGGYLIIDDCSNGLQMWPGCFPGIVPVSIAVDEYMDQRKDFLHLGAVMHNRIWRRI